MSDPSFHRAIWSGMTHFDRKACFCSGSGPSVNGVVWRSFQASTTTVPRPVAGGFLGVSGDTYPCRAAAGLSRTKRLAIRVSAGRSTDGAITPMSRSFPRTETTPTCHRRCGPPAGCASLRDLRSRSPQIRGRASRGTLLRVKLWSLPGQHARMAKEPACRPRSLSPTWFVELEKTRP